MQQSPAVLDDFSQCRCILNHHRPLSLQKQQHNRDHAIHSLSPITSLQGHEIRMRSDSSSEAVWYSSTLCPRSDVHTLFPSLSSQLMLHHSTQRPPPKVPLSPSFSLAWMAKPEKVAQMEGRRRRRCRCCWISSSVGLLNYVHYF